MNKYTGDNLQNLEIPGQIRVTEAGQEVFLGPDDGWKVIIAGSWPSKLRAAGYTGALELGAMIRTLPLNADLGYPDDITIGLALKASGAEETRWAAGYWNYDDWEFFKHGATPEEAVANLMIEHPELWRK